MTSHRYHLCCLIDGNATCRRKVTWTSMNPHRLMRFDWTTRYFSLALSMTGIRVPETTVVCNREYNWVTCLYYETRVRQNCNTTTCPKLESLVFDITPQPLKFRNKIIRLILIRIAHTRGVDAMIFPLFMLPWWHKWVLIAYGTTRKLHTRTTHTS